MVHQLKRKISISAIVLILLSIWLVSYRAMNIDKKEISWDVFGYYLPLQATFINDDPLMEDRAWVEELNNEHQLTGTVYQVSTNDEGEPIYFFLIGMSYMYSVFFAIGHFIAGLFGYAQNGLSPPYQYALVYGCMIYTLVGLYYFRKILKIYFSENITAILLIICVLGTNYSHHMTLKNLETVNVLFMFSAIVIWNTIKWYENYKLKNILAIGISLCLMMLIKPSEVLLIFVPLLWGITSFSDFKKRIHVFAQYKLQLLITVGICLLIAAPQMYYWYLRTGGIYYDSYKNPGVGLDIFHPHLIESLFGYRKGWLLYTPIMVFALLGYYRVFKERRELFLGLLIPFLICYYIIASWTEYWYGAGFSNRPVISLYPLLFISFGFTLMWISRQKKWLKGTFTAILVFFIFLNQFQWWQFRNYILDSTRMTKSYYWSTFLATNVTEKQRELLLVSRDFTGKQSMQNPEKYKRRSLHFFEEIDEKDGNPNFIEYAFTQKIPFFELTKKDHCFVHYSLEYRMKEPEGNDLMLVCALFRPNGAYADSYYPLNAIDTNWVKFDTLYMTPEIRSVNDELKFFFWNRSLRHFEVRNFKVEVYERKK